MWQAAEAMMGEIDSLAPRVRHSAPNAADHLVRSAESVLFNMGEGVGAFRPRVKIACYEVSKKEANEVRAILRRLVIGRMLSDADIKRAYGLAGAVIGMLTSAIISIARREAEEHTRSTRTTADPDAQEQPP